MGWLESDIDQWIETRRIGAAYGQGKTRAGKYGEMRLPARWRLVFLSTGEVTLESHLASIGKRVKAAQQVRVIDPL